MSSPAGHCWLHGEMRSIKRGWANFQVPVLFTSPEVVDIAHNGTLTCFSVYFIFNSSHKTWYVYLHQIICYYTMSIDDSSFPVLQRSTDNILLTPIDYNCTTSLTISYASLAAAALSSVWAGTSVLIPSIRLAIETIPSTLATAPNMAVLTIGD